MFKHSLLKRLMKINSFRKFGTHTIDATEATSLNVPLTEISSLDNGLRIVSENWNTRTSTVGVWIGAGSRYETVANNGVAHFLEHMAFKGTNKRTLQSLELEVENKGAHLNAYTSREMTVFYAKCLNKDIEWAIELLSDILRNSLFETSLIDRERGVILREMEEIESTHQEVVFDYLHATAYQGSSLARTILGPEENVKSLNREDLRTFIKNHYRADKMVLTAAGGIDHLWLKTIGARYLGDMVPAVSRDEDIASDAASLCSRYTGSDLRQSNDRMPIAHMALALEGPGWQHTDTIALMVASSVNGAWDRNHAGMGQATSNLATRFFAAGNVNAFQNFFTCYHDTSLWGIYLTCEEAGVKDAVDGVIDEWRRICTSISIEEVERAKNSLKTNLLMQLDGTTPVCEEIGRHMLTYGRRITPQEMIYRINMVGVDDVRAVCSKYVRNKDPATASIGPIKALPGYEYMRQRFYW